MGLIDGAVVNHAIFFLRWLLVYRMFRWWSTGAGGIGAARGASEQHRQGLVVVQAGFLPAFAASRRPRRKGVRVTEAAHGDETPRGVQGPTPGSASNCPRARCDQTLSARLWRRARLWSFDALLGRPDAGIDLSELLDRREGVGQRRGDRGPAVRRRRPVGPRECLRPSSIPVGRGPPARRILLPRRGMR